MKIPEAIAELEKLEMIAAKKIAPVIQIDTREQDPLDFSAFGIEVEVVALETGDYGLRGLSGDYGTAKEGKTPGEKFCCFERKSLADLYGSLGNGRVRLKAEVERMQEFHLKALLIEASEEEVRNGYHRSQVSPQSVIGSLRSWEANDALSIKFCKSRYNMARQIATWTHYIWKRRHGFSPVLIDINKEKDKWEKKPLKNHSTDL